MNDAKEKISLTPQLETLLAGKDLSTAEATATFEAIISGRVGEVSLAALLVALRAKGETPEELAAFAAAARKHARRIQAPPGTLDTCGTGGDGSQTFNISTAAALVVAGTGIPVAKHGNRAVSSRSGSADVLKTLGVAVDAPAEVMERCLREARLCFLFAPGFHPGMRHAAAVRRELKIRTVFNLIGPLSNPAGAEHQLLGVFSPHWCRPLAEALRKLGAQRALVVCGSGPGGRGALDEVSPWGPTQTARTTENGAVVEEDFDPATLGISAPPAEALQAADAADSARLIRNVLAGKKGPARDVVLLNAAAAAWIAGLAGDWKEGLERAVESIDGGKAAAALEKLVRLSNE